MKGTALKLTLISALLVSALVGVQAVTVAKANPWSIPVPSFQVLSPLPLTSTTYHNESVPLSVMITVLKSSSSFLKISLPISCIRYSVDENPNVTIADLARREHMFFSGEGFIITADSVLQNLSEGNHSLRVYLCDAAGNAISASVKFAVCTRYPKITILSPENKAYNMSDVPLTFFLSEAVSWIAYRVDQQQRLAITGNITLTGLSDGAHQVIVYATNLGASTNASAPTYFTIDTTRPNITLLTVENKTYIDTEVPLNFTVSEPTSWVGYSLDGQANITMAENTTLSGLSYGAHNLTVYASDVADNMGSSKTVYFMIWEPFSTIGILTGVATVAIARGVGLLVYFKKRNH